MANEERGEVDLVAGDRVYTLALSMNALANMQASSKRTFGQTIDAIRGLDLIALRDMLFAALQKHHAKQFTRLEVVGDLVDSLENGMKDAVAAINRLFELNAERGKPKADGAENPPGAQG